MFRGSGQIHSDFRIRSRDGHLDLTDGLQIHLLELPKYAVPSDSRVITDPVEAWQYFFRRANEMTTQEIEQRFNSPAFTEAAEVLDMIQRTPQQRSQYELRLKAQRDDRARLQQARLEGKAEGKAEGIIKALRGVLGIEPTSLDELSLEQLETIASDLQRQIRERGV
ncbi:PD-(D/E)XK nuclease family transposase [Rubripirellula tenax]|uniref:PD-(D/E)XK nuclease family transposase n=1 Tax=Rubripirellula tenax TaxID=2528015 RepID=A0A5C6FFR5_9BACT|nr:PD-(D/E)XK nuclease family transposase [Rubripirellula tenax]